MSFDTVVGCAAAALSFTLNLVETHQSTKKKITTAQNNRLKKESREAPHFTPDDVVHAIESVQRTGLTVYSVDISPDGSISIKTTSPFKRAIASKAETSADRTLDEAQPDKRRA